MKSQTIIKRKYTGRHLTGLVCMLVFVCFLCVSKARGQAIYAVGQSSSTYGCNATFGCGSNTAVTTPGDAVTASLLDFATIRSAKSVLGLGAGGNAFLTLKYANTIPANGITYIKIGTPVFTGLVSGLLGVLGLVNSNIYVDAYHLGTVSSSASNNVTMVTNGTGELFIKASPPVSYDSIRIRVESPVLELASTLALPVYYARYDTTTTSCTEQPVYSSLGATSGVSLNLATAITNPSFAIDNSPGTTASVISTGTIALGASSSQTIFFNGLSNASDEVRVLLSVPPSLLNLGLFNNIQVQTFNGSTATSAVQSVNSALLGLDLLGLFASSNIVPVYFKSTAAYDRVVVTVSQVVSVALPSSVNVYDVKRVPGKPTFTLPVNDTVRACHNTFPTLSADAAGAGYQLQWFSSALATNTTVLYTGNSYTLPFSITQDTVVYVATAKPGCTATSERVPVRILRDALPAAPVIATPAAICAGTTATVSVTATNGIGYRWFKTATGGTQFKDSSIYVTSTLTTDTTFYVEAYNRTTLCKSATRTAVTVTVNSLPASPTVPAVSICTGNTAVVNVTTTTGVRYRWFKTATGGVEFNDSTAYVTSVLTADTTFYVEAYTVATMCKSAVRAAVTVTVRPLPAITLTTPIYACTGSTLINLPYTAAVNSPVTYSIVWSGPATGFNPLTNETLTASPVVLALPANAPVGTYTGTLTVRNNSGGTQCTSINNNFSVIIQSNPNATPVLTSYQ